MGRHLEEPRVDPGACRSVVTTRLTTTISDKRRRGRCFKQRPLLMLDLAGLAREATVTRLRWQDRRNWRSGHGRVWWRPAGYDTANDPVAGIARRVGTAVIALCVNYEGAAIGIEQAGGTGVDDESAHDHIGGSRTICVYREVWQVARVRAIGVLQAMLCAVRVEVGAGRGKGRPFTPAHGVDMHAVVAGRQVPGADRDARLAVLALDKRGKADLDAVRVAQDSKRPLLVGLRGRRQRHLKQRANAKTK